jgi:hypothetical protein
VKFTYTFNNFVSKFSSASTPTTNNLKYTTSMENHIMKKKPEADKMEI